MQKRSSTSFELKTERLGPLPLVNHFLQRLSIEQLLEEFVPTRDRRCSLPYAKGLGVLLRSVIVEREPIYRQYETVSTFAPSAFGLASGEAERLKDDQIGRALDQLFLADRGTLLTEIVVTAGREFSVRFDELHNDSTSIKFTGQYQVAKGRYLRGRRAPWITYGHSKDHRPDLKQLLFVLTSSADGSLPVQFRCEDGNHSDSLTHIETWETLREISGKADFLYVADSKLCSYENMRHIDRQGGRFVTVLPRTRREDSLFREWIQTNPPEWEEVWNRPNPRRKYGRRDRWFVCRGYLPSREGWPVTWVYSTLLAIRQQKSRLERLAQAADDLEELDRKLSGQRPRKRAITEIGEQTKKILEHFKVGRYVQVKIWMEEITKFRQLKRGRPDAKTRYRREVRRRPRINWIINHDLIAYDEKSDGMYPLLSNDKKLSPRQALEAHKRQPGIEKRFEQIKTVHEIAPVFLKNEGRIEAFFFLYFIALLVQAVMERELRLAMEKNGIKELPIYPEERLCHRPTTLQILRLFNIVERHSLLKNNRFVQVFEPQFSDLQKQIMSLLEVPPQAYSGK